MKGLGGRADGRGLDVRGLVGVGVVVGRGLDAVGGEKARGRGRLGGEGWLGA